ERWLGFRRVVFRSYVGRGSELFSLPPPTHTHAHIDTHPYPPTHTQMDTHPYPPHTHTWTHRLTGEHIYIKSHTHKKDIEGKNTEAYQQTHTLTHTHTHTQSYLSYKPTANP